MVKKGQMSLNSGLIIGIDEHTQVGGASVGNYISNRFWLGFSSGRIWGK